MKKFEDLIEASKLSELLKKNEEEKKRNNLVWILAIIGAICAIAGIAYAVYRYMTPDYLEDFDDDFDDEIDENVEVEDDIFEDEGEN